MSYALAARWMGPATAAGAAISRRCFATNGHRLNDGIEKLDNGVGSGSEDRSRRGHCHFQVRSVCLRIVPRGDIHFTSDAVSQRWPY